MCSLRSALLGATLCTNVAFGTMLNIHNNYAPEIHIDWDINVGSGSDKPNHMVIPYGEMRSQELETGWAGAFYIGLLPNEPELGDRRNHDSKVEFGIKVYNEWDHFDLDVEHGMSAPVIIYGGEKSVGCGLDKLATCPEEWVVRDDYNNPVQCRGDLSPEGLQYLRDGCVDMYTQKDGNENKAAAPLTMEAVIGVNSEPTVGRQSKDRRSKRQDSL